MLHLLETGKLLYVIAGFFAVGILSRIISRNLYKRLIKESENMALTKNKNLRNLRQTSENSYRVNHGIVNPESYLEKQLYEMHFFGISLPKWGNITGQISLFCCLLGGIMAFLSYWYRADSYYMILYGAAGIFCGLFLTILDYGGTDGEKRRLIASLQDYLDNIAFSRKTRISEGPDEAPGTYMRGARKNQSTAVKATVKPPKEEEKDDDTRLKDTEYLKKSLNQIAASRERTKTSDNWLRDLNPEELKLVGEIIREYLS